MVLPLLRLGPKVSQRDVAIALEELERYLNRVRELVNGLEGSEPEPSTGTVQWSDILGVPSTFPPSAHTHPIPWGPYEHGNDQPTVRPDYGIVVFIGSVPPLGIEEGGVAENRDWWMEVSPWIEGE